ncbi:MAG: hypothetical protein DHS20C21_23910 [Gemmatimonadota bacterium]|nr:MAG: hypothetical protein DHS20C21_23910 [Gemmatimonadota bacterium]
MLLTAACSLAIVSNADARTAGRLANRIVVDGITDEWEPDESLFQLNVSDPGNPVLEESLSDSKWGFQNDINQVRVTWDADFLYVAVDAIIFDNNVILLFDYRPGGMVAMTDISAWRRNFVFQGIQPDLFLATWDGNTLPQVWNVQGNDATQQDATTFQTVATFSKGTQGRSMEAAIPWPFLLGPGAPFDFSTTYNDSVYTLPPDIHTLKVVAILTAGADGTGGPDSAPDNLQGHDVDGAQRVTVDNWAIIPLDLTSPGGGGADGVVDFGADIRERLSFRVPPPIVGVRQEIREISFNAPIISPEQGGRLEFEVSLTPEVPASEDFRTVTMTAEVFNLSGNKVKTLYRESVRPASSPRDASVDLWDGRDERGRLVEGGTYLLRLVLEPESQREIKAFSVVR